MQCDCARPRALSRSLSLVELVTAMTVVQQIGENDLQNTVSTDLRVEITVFHVMAFALFRFFSAS